MKKHVSNDKQAAGIQDLAIWIMAKSLSDGMSEALHKLIQNRPDCILYTNGNIQDAILEGKVIPVGQEDIAEQMANGPSWIMIADPQHPDLLAHIPGVFGSVKKQLHEGVVNFSRRSEKEKSGWGEKLNNGIFNLFGQLITPTGQSDLTQPYIFFPKAIASAAYAPTVKQPQDLAARAGYLKYGFDEVVLSGKESQHKMRPYGRVLSQAIRSRINWFFKDAIGTEHSWWKPAWVLFTVFALISMLIMSQQFGMTWDEKRHNDYSKESLKYFESFGEDTTCLSATLPTQEFRYYGEHFNVIAAFLYSNVLSMGEFETRHLLNALYGFLAMLFAALLAKEIASWRASLIAILLIYLSPVFFAHSMNNPTDIPFACGFSMALYYLLKVFTTLPRPKTAHLVMAAVGVGIAVGSRVGGILLYAYAGLFFGIHFLMQFKKNRFKSLWFYVRSFLILLVVGHLLSVSLWPFGQQHILTNWYEALKKSTEGAYFTYNHELFEGARIYMANVPWYYLPKFIFMNAPLVVIAGFAFSLLLIWNWKKLWRSPVLAAFVLFALIFPIVYAEYQSMYYYNGWRHYLFVYPPMVILAALGWEGILLFVKKPAPVMVVTALMLALCALPATWMARNHPNECVYFNELVGGTKGAYGKYETDYYSNSCRAAGEWIAMQEPNKKLVVAINNEPQTAAYYATQMNPNLEFRWVREYEEQKPFWDYLILTSRTFGGKELQEGSFPPKGTVHVIEADGAPLAAIVKREDYNMPLGYQAMNNKNLDSAVIYFSQATRYNPKDEETWRMLGNVCMMKGMADSAIQFLNKAIEISPENYSAYNDLGLVYMNLKKDNASAIKQFEKATDLKYNFAEGYYYAASCYMMSQDYNHAITLFEKGLKRGGNSIPELYYNLGLCYLNTGLNKKAEENFILCLTLNPNFAMGYRALAEAFSKQGKQGEAEQCMQRYMQLGGR